MVEFTDSHANKLEAEMDEVIYHALNGSRKAWKFLQIMNIRLSSVVERVAKDDRVR
jgi:hypothetical protein